MPFVKNSIKRFVCVLCYNNYYSLSIEELFKHFQFLITFRGSFQATEGSVKGVSSIYRVGDTLLGYDNETLLHFYGVLGFRELHVGVKLRVQYNYMKHLSLFTNMPFLNFGSIHITH